jgi:DNA-binding XRE family transcriptional regulator
MRLAGQFGLVGLCEAAQSPIIRPGRAAAPAGGAHRARGLSEGRLHQEDRLEDLEVGGKDLAQLDLPQRLGRDLLRPIANPEPGEYVPATRRPVNQDLDRHWQVTGVDAYPEIPAGEVAGEAVAASSSAGRVVRHEQQRSGNVARTEVIRAQLSRVPRILGQTRYGTIVRWCSARSLTGCLIPCMALIDEVIARQLPSVRTRRAIRLAARVSQVRMAAELGVHRLTLISWENGTHEPRGESAERYAQLLNDLKQVTS